MFLIVLEGLDGVGKTTIASLIHQRYAELEIHAESISFPGREPGTLGRLVYDVHHAPTDFMENTPPPESIQLLHLAAHIATINNVILPLVGKGTIVILDRFWPSLYSYGLTSGGNPKAIEKMVEIEKLFIGNKLNILSFNIQRPNHLNPRLPDNHTDLVSHYEYAFNNLCDFPVVTIENTGSLDDVIEEIFSRCEDFRESR